jgi:hypothetical protein
MFNTDVIISPEHFKSEIAESKDAESQLTFKKHVAADGVA